MIHIRESYSYQPGGRSQYLLAGPPPSEVLELERRHYSLDEAYGFCSQMAQTRYENVPVASRFLPPEMRPHVQAIYAFVRAAKDFADEPFYAPRRGECLDLWEHELYRAFHGEADHPIFAALMDTVDKHDLPATPFLSLLTAFRMDQCVSGYGTIAELRRYCEHSCQPLGHLMLYLFGYRSPDLLRFSDDMCAGLQMATFLQDLALDLARVPKGRLYIPREDLCHFGVTEESLDQGDTSQRFRDLMSYQICQARSLLVRGRPLLDRVGQDLAFELELTWQSGQAVLDKIEGVDFDVFRKRPVLSSADRARLLAVALTKRWPRFIGRKA